MNAAEIIAELKELYPQALIKQISSDQPTDRQSDQPTEIICEFDSRENHPEWSLAIAVIDRSAPHYHKKIVETYRVLRGELHLHVGNQELTMYEGQTWEIGPNTIHWAQGDATWVEIYCSPGYDAGDHHLVDV